MLDLNDSAGVVTLSNWTMMPDGEKYLYVWAEKWVILTDKQLGEVIEGFRSTEHWQLAAKVGDKYVLIVPGCVVKGWARCEEPVAPRDCYQVRKPWLW